MKMKEEERKTLKSINELIDLVFAKKKRKKKKRRARKRNLISIDFKNEKKKIRIVN